MQISPVSYYGYANYASKKVNNNQKNSLNSNVVSNNINFTANAMDFYVPYAGVRIQADYKRLNLLEGSEAHLQDVGEYLRTTDDHTIKTHFAFQPKWDGFRHVKKSEEAYKRLAPYVEMAKIKYDNIIKQLEYLEEVPESEDTELLKEQLLARKREMDYKADRAMEWTLKIFADDVR